MSRIGKKPIEIPKGVTAALAGGFCVVKGARGEMKIPVPGDVSVTVEKDIIHVARKGDIPKQRALHGLMRQLVANATVGVSVGFTRRLEVKGVGYRIEMKGKDLEMELGFSHPVKFTPSAGITLSVEEKSFIVVAGVDKQKVGQTAAEIRAIKPPDPYKAKGIKYVEEVIRRKVGKVGA